MTSRQQHSNLMRQGKSNALQGSMWNIQGKFSNEPQKPNPFFFFFPERQVQNSHAAFLF